MIKWTIKSFYGILTIMIATTSPETGVDIHVPRSRLKKFEDAKRKVDSLLAATESNAPYVERRVHAPMRSGRPGIGTGGMKGFALGPVDVGVGRDEGLSLYFATISGSEPIGPPVFGVDTSEEASMEQFAAVGVVLGRERGATYGLQQSGDWTPLSTGVMNGERQILEVCTDAVNKHTGMVTFPGIPESIGLLLLRATITDVVGLA